MAMKVVALAGGVGGAKLVDGLAQALGHEALAVIVNTGDDFEHLGLMVCPDLDTVTYTLAGIANPETGWGRAEETWDFLDRVRRAGGPAWFRIGDRDLRHHMERTDALKRGARLSQVTHDLARGLGVRVAIDPMSDEPVRTIVLTQEGDLGFQAYFVERACEPRVRGFRFEGSASARPAPGTLERLQAADLVVLGPSNPWVSLDPILAVPGLRQAVAGRRVVGVSPIVGGKALRGPAAKMCHELGEVVSPVTVARHFADVLEGFVIDRTDAASAGEIEALGMRVLVTSTIMRTRDDRARLARQVVRFGGQAGR